MSAPGAARPPARGVRRWRGAVRRATLVAMLGAALLAAGSAWGQESAAGAAPAVDSAGEEGAAWNLHAQATNVTQYHPAFNSPYAGANSLASANATNETADVTAFAGRQLWSGAALYVDPEIDQGFGFSDTLGVAGFPSGEAYKLGFLHPYFRLPRTFVRQVIGTDEGGPASAVADGPNQLAGSLPADNVTVTAGKFSVVDIFDTNRYAHDPRGDFLNWAIIESGAFDYPADPWGFTYGAAAEWTRDWWTWRVGVFALSKTPNGRDIDGSFAEHGWITEFEVREDIEGHPGKVRLLGFDNHGQMGSYDAALALAAQTGEPPDTALVRRDASRPGFAINAEQELASDLGVFLRLSANDGSKETFDFTDINRSLATGLSLQGARWRRPDDTVGLAVAVDAASSAARAYLAAGGMGVLIGDGRLDYGLEQIVEAYYAWRPVGHLTVSADLQFIDNPAYNRDRGPVAVFGIRLHADY
jgi:high affinity Mn2+ porin